MPTFYLATKDYLYISVSSTICTYRILSSNTEHKRYLLLLLLIGIYALSLASNRETVLSVAHSTTSQTWKTPIVVVVVGGGADLVGILYDDDDEQRLKDRIIIISK